jgi:DNA-binding CsgD family transcriptional regulator/tetratricopeptide (TPR) repeat protein
MKALNLVQLEDRLEHTFELLTGGSRTAPSRQQTLRATVDWSYQLLTESERALFRRLSVFAGGWSLESAERVASGEPFRQGDTLYLLERLIDKSLVVAEERHGTVRQSMLDTLREYAHERLVEAGEEQQVRRRHFEWVLDVARSINPEQLDPRLRTADGLEVHNLRSALGWSIEAGEAELGLRLASAVGLVWNYRGHFAEGICWLEKLLGQPRVAALPRCRGRALKWIGVLNYGLGNMNTAQASITESYQLLAGQVDEQEAPLGAHLLGNIARARGDLVGAARLYQQTLTEYRQMGLQFWEAVILFLIGSVLFEQGDYAGSRAACERCLTLGREREFTWATSRARVMLAYLANHDGDEAAAQRHAQDALAEQRDREEAAGIAIALRALSQFALEKGCLSRAWDYLAEALEIARVEGDCMALARTLETVACVLASQRPSQAAQIAGAASTLRARTGTVPWPSEQVRLERWLDIGRQKIGERAFDSAWALGELFSESEAISAANCFIAEALAPPTTKSDVPHHGGPLTARQLEVVALVAQGMTNDQIAQELVISPATARAHVEHVLDRLGLHSRAQVAVWATEHGLRGIAME